VGAPDETVELAATVAPDEAVAPADLGALAGKRFFCSWSGGKDSYLALQRAVAAGGRPGALLTMLHEGGSLSRGHGLPVTMLGAQAAALGVPLVTRATTWEGYEEAFVAALHELREMDIADGVFGDIDLAPHREWVEAVCARAGMSCHLPLWQQPRRALLDELFAAGVRTTVVAVDAKRLAVRFLGREVDGGLVAELEAEGVDACGEDGEYHTVVTEAPLFSGPVPLAWTGKGARDGHWVLEFA
jgi:diphthine-ammonia ligase